MSVLQSGITKSLAADYTIDQSLRFDEATDPTLSRTPTVAGNRKTYTVSAWVKRGKLELTYPGIFLAGVGTTDMMRFTNTDEFGYRASTSYEVKSTGLYRDPAAWYHCVMAVDTTESTPADRVKLYINGDEITDFATSDYPAEDYEGTINNTVIHYVGTGDTTSARNYDGYIAELYVIDGQALDADSFGETDDTTNQWKPIDSDDVKDAVTFGTNGFYQKYAATELAASFTDSAGEYFTPTEDITCNLLLVAGGGAGGGYYGGGGGGGGVIDITGQSLRNGTAYGVNVGDGGTASTVNAGGSGAGSSGGTGGDTTFFSLTAKGGGGGGGGGISVAGVAGGSGGGGTAGSTSGGATNQSSQSGDSGTYGYGYAGGGASTSWGYASPGGGGAGEVGESTSDNNTGGAGGDGRASSITGSSVTYAGGGGGGSWSPSSYQAPGGAGGGGAGQASDGTSSVDGTDGKGGGGGGIFGGSATPSTGGSGVVIISYISTTAKATGGTITTYTSGADTYQVHSFSTADAGPKTITANGDVANVRGFGNATTNVTSFTSTGSVTWVAPVGVTSVDYLVVAGGGGAGGRFGGGGGAGGFRTATGFSVTPGTSYTVTVGAGGAGGVNTQLGTVGGDSVFSTITSDGGGGGGAESAGSGVFLDGGSGGGGSYQYPDGEGEGVAGQGYDGGTGVGSGSGYYPAGGGGGSSAVGADADTNGHGGAGGAGTASSISGTSVTYAGGGGGSCYTGRTPGAGGSGGGGAGSGTTFSNGNDATGYGSGGGGGSGSGANGGAGSNGIVILSYTNNVPGTTSIAFDGTGDYLTVPSSSDFGFGTGAFTLEGWVRIASTGTQWIYGGSVSNNLDILYNYSSTKFDVYLDEVEYNFNSWTANVDTWYHIALCRSGTDLRVFVDGTQIDSTKTSSDSVPTTGIFIGAQYNAASAWNGYMDELRISDSARYTSAFTPSTTQFTADANTMLLIHSDWDGGLGADSSGNGNDFAANNLVATDQMKDSPTNNFCTLNPLNGEASSGGRKSYQVLSEGSLKSVGSSASDTGVAPGTWSFGDSGKWYFEFVATAFNGNYPHVGMVDALDSENQGGYVTNGVMMRNDGEKIINSSNSSYGSSTSVGDVIGMAVDCDNGAAYFSINNTWQDSGDPTSGGSQTGAAYTWTAGTIEFTPTISAWNTSSGAVANFGQDSSFAGEKTAQGNGGDGFDFYFEPPTDYVALSASNLPNPEIKLPGDHFNMVLWAGNSSTQSITGVGFQPDFTWIKKRSGVESNQLFDAIRGATEALQSDTTAVEATIANSLTSFDSDGFSLGYVSEVNNSSHTYVGWNWLAGGGAGSSNTDGATNTTSTSANVTAGFSISTLPSYAGSTTFGHGLSVAPDLVIMKPVDGADVWLVGSTAVGWTKGVVLNTAAAESTNSVYWDNTAPDATVVSLGTQGNSYIKVLYCFHSIEGYSKFGTYTGNGDADGTFIYTGFRPAYYMIRKVNLAPPTGWMIEDRKREKSFNDYARDLVANEDVQEQPDTRTAMYSNGFKIIATSNNFNTSGSTYLYIAFAEYPFKYAPAR